MKKLSIIFSVPLLPPSLNVMLRTHWRKRQLEQNRWDFLIMTQWLRFNKAIIFKPVKITYTLTFAKRRNRDFDNYIGGTKYITDALKRTFLLRDDSNWLRKVEVEFKEGNPETNIKIEEI